ncbi:MAG: pirin family protein [Pirellulales bacterium]|nr:pirin family protein [Pirellulales bacterium]
MFQVRKSNARGHVQHGWLESFHTFSFADYHDPQWTGYRHLRVINDDWIMPGQGFGQHPHRDMEIITYMLEGELEHRDSLGNGRILRAGDVQYMAAGTGILHSEFNPNPATPTHLLQIWIKPDTRGVAPRYAEMSLTDQQPGTLRLVASADGRAGSILIHQDADLWIGKLNTGQEVFHSLNESRHLWLHVATGEITVNGQMLAAGDALYGAGPARLSLTCVQPAQALLFDLA